MKTAQKMSGVVLVGAVIVLFVVVNYSSVQSRFECAGSVSSSPTDTGQRLYLKLELYRWWVGLWSASDGSLWVEIPNRHVQYFRDIRQVGDQLQILDSDTALAGQFSQLSNALSLKTTAGFFDGRCKPID
jgi:hypothetical protein